MNREIHVRLCERLGAKFPGPTRRWRECVGLPRGGPSAVITTKGILRFGEDGEACLASAHPGVGTDDIVDNTGWKLRIPNQLEFTLEPSVEELKVIREYDKEGFWTKQIDGRAK